MTDVERQVLAQVGPRGLLLARELARRAKWSPKYRRSQRVVWGWFQGPTRGKNPNMAEELAVSERQVRRLVDRLTRADVDLSAHGIAAPVPLVIRQRPYTPGFPGKVPYPCRPCLYRLHTTVVRLLSRFRSKVGRKGGRVGRAATSGQKRSNCPLTRTGHRTGGPAPAAVTAVPAKPAGKIDCLAPVGTRSASVAERCEAIAARVLNRLAASREGATAPVR